MTELLYIRTVPHTGTHFLLSLLQDCLDQNIFRLEGVHQGITKKNQKISASVYMRKVINKELSVDSMIRKLLELYRCSYKLKYLGLYEHLALPGTPAFFILDTWIYDFTFHGYPGYPVKTIMTLRNPRDVVISIMLRTIGNGTERKNYLNWARIGYGFMARHYNEDNFYYLPVDILKNKSPELRYRYLINMFDGLGIRYTIKLNSFVNEWKAMNTIYEHNIKKTKEYYLLMELKEGSRKPNKELDMEMTYYRSDPIIRMLKKYGYDEI